MAGRGKYIILLLITACIMVFIIIYGISGYSPRQEKPGGKKDTPPIGQNKQQEEVRPPKEEPLPVPEIQPIPAPVPTPQQKPRLVPKPAEKAAVPKGSIGSYKTPLLDKSCGRTNNITLAAKRINGYIVEPGGSFSFNGIVGERTIQRGYKPAKVIIKGEFVDDTGGGICQLSSTLYNAAEKAGLQIIERHKHSRKVSYVKEGCDAAVDYGNLDFKFKNTMSYPVEIRAGVKNGEVYAFIIKLQQKIPASP